MSTSNDLHEPAELAEHFRELTGEFGQADVATALQTICDLAVTVMQADHASVSAVVRGTFQTLACTDEKARGMDVLQERLKEGPCLDAMEDVNTHVSGELADDQRWPRFGRAAADELGAHSVLCHVLRMEDGSVGALNLSASRAHAFTPAHEQLAVIFGAQAAAALRAAGEHDRAEHLERALRTNRRIGMAVGIIMRDRGLDEEAAFRALTKASQDSNTKVAQLAEQVVRTGTLEA
jgi:GAF domain-containing protein